MVFVCRQSFGLAFFYVCNTGCGGMIAAIIGFLAPFIPDLLGLGKGWIDHKQEMEMVRLQAELADREHAYRMDETLATAQVAENRMARQPHQSFGVQILDKAHDSDGVVWRWSFNLVFLAFAWIDGLISSVRPVVTYWAFALYTAAKTATMIAVYQASANYSDGVIDALSKVGINESFFTDFDQEMLMLVIGFWFGQRIRNGRASANAKS
ncbi:hypothetical protein COO20_09695 [Thalassospira marina]|uniref:Uncharacterized protein n=2 Tax=Thalassospira marina TaxID=2048283 RepID=A0A2N3KVA4_9PROT|nr:hypothetical protein COO20_09695 [Thalassospira marina]